MNYSWEAETAGGDIVTVGPEKDGSLNGFVRLSYIPGPGVPLPRHDFIGVPMIRRFRRRFLKTHMNSREDLPGLIFWEDGSDRQRTSEDLRNFLNVGDYVGKGVAGEKWYLVRQVTEDEVFLSAPYSGNPKPRGLRGRKICRGLDKQTKQIIHCIELESGQRIWIRDETGSILTTSKDKDLYI